MIVKGMCYIVMIWFRRWLYKYFRVKYNICVNSLGYLYVQDCNIYIYIMGIYFCMLYKIILCLRYCRFWG